MCGRVCACVFNFQFSKLIHDVSERTCLCLAVPCKMVSLKVDVFNTDPCPGSLLISMQKEYLDLSLHSKPCWPLGICLLDQ